MIPTDRSFGLDDVCNWLREDDPERTFVKRTISNNVSRLIKEGDLKRVAFRNGKHRAAYTTPSFECDEPAPMLRDWPDMVLVDAGALMTATEIMVAMIARGFTPKPGPKRALVSLVWGMRRRADRFKRNGRKWSVV